MVAPIQTADQSTCQIVLLTLPTALLRFERNGCEGFLTLVRGDLNPESEKGKRQKALYRYPVIRITKKPTIGCTRQYCTLMATTAISVVSAHPEMTNCEVAGPTQIRGHQSLNCDFGKNIEVNSSFDHSSFCLDGQL